MNHILIAHNLRSCYNVGSLLRTCDGLGVDMIMSGTTPYPKSAGDPRLPHVARRADSQIAKTALGAETSVNWRHSESLLDTIADLRDAGYKIAALEQTDNSIDMPRSVSDKWAMIVGNEPNGIDPHTLSTVDEIWEIPMRGQKQSFNVATAAAIGLWSLNQK